MFTASYFVNWSYQNSKACTVLVGESTELFPASKATTLESNKSLLARPHQSSLSTATGNETHSRPRRSVDVDGHASVTSVPISSLEPVTVDKMHEITTPSIDVSLAHGVESASGIIEEGSNASMVSDVDVSNTGDLTKLEITSVKEIVEKTTITTTTEGVPKITTMTKTTPITNSFVPTVKITNIRRRVESPLEISRGDKEPIRKDNIAYDPKDMQGDAFPSIYSYGAQKLQYLKLLTRLNQVNEELHINLKDAEVPDSNLKKFKYESEKSTTKVHNTIAPPFLTTEPTTITKIPITSKPTERLTLITTNKFVALTEPVVNTSPTPIVTNNNLANTTAEEPITQTTTIFVEEKTVNAPEMKTTEASNPKHVLINLTISSDDAENSAYKPIYSLTLTVPTLGDTNEIPTVKITPMDVEPTQPSNFNKPVTLEGMTTSNKAKNTEEWGGTCECACPICNINTTDDFYDDYTDILASTEYAITSDASTTESVAETERFSTDMSSETTLASTTDKTSTTEDVYSTTDDIASTTDGIISTIDFITESDTEVPPTTIMPCVCPKVEPPPILILEGEVDLITISDNLLTVTTTINR